MMAADKKPIPYDETPFPGWDTAVNSWPWHPTETTRGKIVGWWKEGACPRCHDNTRIPLGLTEGIVATDDSRVYAQCECTVQHAANKTGCGARAMIAGPSDE
jgi:hypothetical protein